jgi:hypothetical protein
VDRTKTHCVEARQCGCESSAARGKSFVSTQSQTFNAPRELNSFQTSPCSALFYRCCHRTAVNMPGSTASSAFGTHWQYWVTSALAPRSTFLETWTTHLMPPPKLNFNDRHLGLSLPSEGADADPPGYSCRQIKPDTALRPSAMRLPLFNTQKQTTDQTLSIMHHAHSIHNTLICHGCLYPRASDPHRASESRLPGSPSSRGLFRAIDASLPT